jgi:outer membrane protein assembly factor BamB
LATFLSLYNFTDLIYKPDKSLNSVPASGDWAMFGRDPVHSGAINPADISIQGNVKSLLTAGSAMQSSPAVVNGIAYVGSRDGKLYAIQAATGTKLWEFQTGSFVESSPAIVDNVVYFGSNEDFMLWMPVVNDMELPRSLPIKSSPAVADGRIYFGSDDYSIYALNADNGKELWRFATGDVIQSSPVVANGLVYVGSWDGFFYALDARSGRLHLKMPGSKAVVASPIAEGNTVYFVNSAGNLIALHGNARNWPFENRIRPNWEILYIYGAAPAPPVSSGYLWSLNLAASSTPRPARAPAPSPSSTSSPTLVDGKLFIGVAKKVVAVDIQGRNKIWETEVGGLVNSTPIVVNNTVYAAAKDGRLYLLNATTGEKLKDIAIGGEITSTPALVDGTIYISSQDGNLYAVN